MDDYPFEHHQLQARINTPEERRYYHSWKYLILMGLARLRLSADQSVPTTAIGRESLEMLRSFVKDSYGSVEPDLATLFNPARELHLKPTFKVPFIEIEGERMPVEDLPIHVAEVNKAIQHHLLTALNPGHKYFICFDQLDRYFTAGSDGRQQIIGLLLAAWDIYTRFHDSGVNVVPAVFLRDDIYADMHFEDKNKLTENQVVHVRWDQHDSEFSLRRLMESRFSRVLGRDVVWEDVFDDEPPNETGSSSLYDAICDHTFLRPRDMIKICNEVLAQHRKRNGNVGNVLTEEDLRAARSGFSTFLLGELDDEVNKHLPLYREYLGAIERHGETEVAVSELVKQIQRTQSRNHQQESPPIDVISELFEFSIVGFQKVRGRGAGRDLVWKYRSPNAAYDVDCTRLYVHPGLWEGLELNSPESPPR